MPEARHHHMLNGAFLAIGQFHFYLLLAHAWSLAAFRTNFRGTFTRALAAYRARLWWRLHALTRVSTAFDTRFRFQRLSVPLGVAEMMVRLHKIVNCEI